MSRTAYMTIWLFASTALQVAYGQPYVISTYAGGAPLPPTSALTTAVDSSGNIYFVDGLTYTGMPALSNSIFKIDTQGAITRVAGDSRTGFSGDGGPATQASLNSPRGVAVDSAGNVFIVDAGNARIRKVSPSGIITTVAGGGSAVLGDGGPALEGQLNYPNSIAVDAAGNLFIGEYGRVRKVTPAGVISTVAGGGSSTADKVPATSAQLTSVNSLAVDAAGDLFIAEVDDETDDDFDTSKLLKVSPDGTIATIAVSASYGYASIAADSGGNLLFSSSTAIWKLSPTGNKTVVAGTLSYGSPSGDGQPAIHAQLSNPTGLSVDASGDIFIADNSGRNLREVTPDGIIHGVGAIPGSTLPPSGDSGPAVGALLQVAVPGLIPQGGVATDSAGNLYIAETAAHRVRKVSVSGTITTVAGTGVPRCNGSTCLPLGDGGPATSAALYYPTSVGVDGAGNLFIADCADLRVRKVSPDGSITTVAGNGNAPAYPASSVDGSPAAMVALIPYILAVDGAGNIFISASEGGPAYLSKVTPDGTIHTVLPSSSGSPSFGLVNALATDRTGNLFVAGSTCDDIACVLAIIKVSAVGSITTITSGNQINFQGTNVGDGGPISSAQLGFIAGLAADGAGNLFLADLFGERIRKIDASGIINTIGGNGLVGYSGDGGPGVNATMNYPLGLAMDAAGDVYFSDFNQAVRVLRPSANPSSK